MKKKILYIDMDGVVANFEKEMNVSIPNWRTMTEKEVDDKVTEMCLNKPNLFHDLEPMDGAVETVKKLFDHFEVYFLSTPMWKSPESFIGKRLWIEEHFGDLAIKRLILSHRKDLNIGDYLIDDRTHNGAGEFTGEHIHYGTEKFPNWETVYEYLTEPKDERMVGMTISEKTGKVVTTYAVNTPNFDKREVDDICEVYGYNYKEVPLSEFKNMNVEFNDDPEQLIQIRIIEHNDNEGEDFTYVLMVSKEVALKLKQKVDEEEYEDFEIEIETSYTKKEVKKLNDHVDNGYMDYIAFYEFRTDIEYDLDDDLSENFYKGGVLKKIE